MRDLILGLARPMLRLLGRDERGAVGVLVGILIGGGVLVGMGALVIDVGQLYQERAELQNGADAGALAVAKSCATGSCTPGLAVQYASKNASALTGGKEAASLVCGSGTLGACPASTSAMTDCPSPPANVQGYVDVHTQTSSGTGLPPVFAKALLGNGSYAGTTVLACAQAAWGAPSSLNTIAFTISACSWYQYTNYNPTTQTETLAPPPPYPPNPSASLDHIVYEHGSGPTGSLCPEDNQSGADAAGNFGWTSDSGNCSVTVSSGTYSGNTGASVSSACQTALYNDWLNKTVVYLPVYNTIGSGTGNNATYTLLGFAAFVITGYHITGSFSEPDWLNSANNCTGNQFCIYGFFTQKLIQSTGGLGGTALGASIVELKG